jgi:ABC-type Zn uptake system ZnuABC Zn-binding protein ZnuA
MHSIYERTRWLAFLPGLALVVIIAAPVFGQTSSKLRVVTSTADLGALAAEVGGDRAEVESLARGNQDPHFVQAKPSYLLKLRQADLLIIVGMELESGWLTRPHHTPSLLSQSGNPRIQPGASGYFDASQYAEILEAPTRLVTPSIQPFGNPHYWLDPENGRKIAQALAKKMSEMRPGDASYFNERFSAFSQRLSDAEKGWDTKMEPYRGRKVVTYSRSWSNFLKHFQLVSVGEIEQQPGISPSPPHTRELIQLMKSNDVEVILVEPYFELNTPHAIARETGAAVVVMPSSVGGEKGVSNYFQLFDYDLDLLTRAFRSKP